MDRRGQASRRAQELEASRNVPGSSKRSPTAQRGERRPPTGRRGELATRGRESGGRAAAEEKAAPSRPTGPQHGVKSQCGTYGGMMGRAVKENQDNFFVHTGGRPGEDGGQDFYLGVVDGHGMQGAEVSGFLRNKLGPKAWQAAVQAEDVPSTLAQKFSETAEELRRSGIEAPPPSPPHNW